MDTVLVQAVLNLEYLDVSYVYMCGHGAGKL